MLFTFSLKDKMGRGFCGGDTSKGFGLVETIVGVAVFVLISTSAYAGFVKILQGIQVLKIKNAALSLATEQIEISRNLPYADVGVVDGIPSGKIPREKTENRGGIDFNIIASVRSIDDPFDGQIGSEPNDLAPADYKMVEFDVACVNCVYTNEMKFYTIVSPQNLEITGNNGALFINVFDANGQPVVGANVNVYNNSGTTTINIDETTNNQGVFQIVDAPPGTEDYQITVTKDGYSTEKTYTVGSIENPAPDMPHANVVAGELTEQSFSIDKLSSLLISTKNRSCNAVGDVEFNLHGDKTIGYETYKYDEDLSTDSGGELELDEVEWDNYVLTLLDNDLHLVGASQLLPIDIIPDTENILDLIVAPADGSGLFVQIQDSENGELVEDANITLTKGSTEYDPVTSRGTISQTDWSGGSGQENISDGDNKFYSDDGNVEYLDISGELSLASVEGVYATNSALESSILDIGVITNFSEIIWTASSQPIETGAESIKFQIATNAEVNASTTWSFVGPDGTSDSYYVNSGEDINSIHDGERYLKYKVFLSTEDTGYTPVLDDVSLSFGSECESAGQFFFAGLDTGGYSIEISKDGYQTYLKEDLDISSGWQMLPVTLNVQ